MGNRSAKPAPAKPKDDVIRLKVVPPIDHALCRWLARDLERIYRFVPVDQEAIKPPDHYIEYMRLSGWLDVDLDDPDLAYLFRK